jgi:hypothetical protein
MLVVKANFLASLDRHKEAVDFLDRAIAVNNKALSLLTIEYYGLSSNYLIL